MIMMGTISAVTLLIDLMPPSRTIAVKTASTTPTTAVFSPKVVCSAAATEFDCVMLPMPKAASDAATAKNSDRPNPNLFGIAFAR